MPNKGEVIVTIPNGNQHDAASVESAARKIDGVSHATVEAKSNPLVLHVVPAHMADDAAQVLAARLGVNAHT